MKKIIKFCLIYFALIAFSLAADEWQVVSKMRVPVAGGSAVVHDSLIYIVGGFQDSSYNASNLIQVYNPKKNSWSFFEDSLSQRRYGLNALNYNGSMLIFGGSFAPGILDFSLESWDFENTPVISSHNFHFNRIYSTAQIYQNNLYLFGGYSTISAMDTSPITYIVEYDIPADTIVYATNGYYPTDGINRGMPIQQMSALVNDQIYIFGGAYNGVMRDISRFNIPDRTLDRLDAILFEERAAGAAVSFDEQSVLIIGGYGEYSVTDNTPSLSTVELFRFNDDNSIEHRYFPEMKFRRSELMAVVFDSCDYVFGGYDSYGRTVREVEMIRSPGAATAITEKVGPTVVQDFALEQNYPNPFNPETTIRYQLPVDGFVSLVVYNVLGQRVRTLVNTRQTAGKYSVSMNANELESGMYFYRLSAPNFSAVKRMIIIK